jgi:hypothetical protein
VCTKGPPGPGWFVDQGASLVNIVESLERSLAWVQHCAHKEGCAGGIIDQHEQEGPAGHEQNAAHSSNDMASSIDTGGACTCWLNYCLRCLLATTKSSWQPSTETLDVHLPARCPAWHVQQPMPLSTVSVKMRTACFPVPCPAQKQKQERW